MTASNPFVQIVEIVEAKGGERSGPSSCRFQTKHCENKEVEPEIQRVKKSEMIHRYGLWSSSIDGKSVWSENLGASIIHHSPMIYQGV